jgi:ketosteroid isomerase-like protein
VAGNNAMGSRVHENESNLQRIVGEELYTQGTKYLKAKYLVLNRGLLARILGALLCCHAFAQTQTASDSLVSTVQALDTKFFEAYNHCDLATTSSMVAEELEFYHDLTGLSTGRQALLDALKNNICGKVTRELVPGTLEIYPIAKYGAVEIGVHRFHHPNDSEVGEAKFIILWQNKDGAWKIARTISFDHHSLTK